MTVANTRLVRVLLVEDEPADAESTKRALSSGVGANFELCCAQDLPEAVECLQSGKFGMLLLDLGLPGCCGLEALQEIRREDRDVPIIVLTGLNDERLALEAIEQGAQDYLIKGKLTAESLARSIRYAMQRQELLAAAFERELAVTRAEARKSAMLDSALDAIVTIDHDGKIVEFNPAAERTFGHARAEMMGKPIAEAVIPPSYREKYRQGFERYLATGESRVLNRRLELTALRADGSEFPVELTITRIPIPGPPMFTAYIRDVSDRKVAQESLDERVRLATLTSSIGMILTRGEDLGSTLRACAEILVNHLDAAFARIWTLNEHDNVLELQASAGMYTHLDGPHGRVPMGLLKIGYIAAERRPHLTNEVIGDPRVGDQEWAKREGMVAFAGYPLVVEDRLVGVMAMFARHKIKPATFDALAAVADQIAAGIERKRAEENLQFTQFTIDHVSTPVFWSDSEGRFFNVNGAACRLTGYSREELLLLSVSDVNPNIPQQGWPALWNEIRGRGTLAMESCLRRKDGTEISVSVDSNFLQLKDRECSCTFLQDITERKQAEQAQRQSELRFHAVFERLQLQIERMPLAYVLFDADLRLVDWNPAAEEIFGYRKEDVLGMEFPFEKILPHAFRPQAAELLQRIRNGDMSAYSTNDNLTKDGRTITCEWLNTPLASDDGSFNGLMCLAQDVTDRRRLEEQFRQAQKLEAIGSLAGSIAHEFNNLVQAISGYTKFAIEGLAPEEQRFQDLQLVLKSADRAAELTKQLLSFGRRQVLQRESVDPNQVVADLVKMLCRLIGENIEIQTHLASDTAAIYADSGQLQQMLLNLCINARDAMPNGGRLIIRTQTVSLSENFCEGCPGAKAGTYVLMTVADTGRGMSPEVKQRIFEPFFTTKELGKGTGLGLAMVYGMVEQHGGIIHVYSELGSGTTFKIYLPVSALDKTQSLPSASPVSIGGNETILIVEDDPMVRDYLTRILETAGYTTLAATDGAAGLRVFTEHSDAISLAVLDVVMPRMGGRELFHRLRSMAPDIRVIFCTGHDPEVYEAESVQQQGFPLLHKPVEPSLLLRTLRTVLDAPAHDSGSAGVPAENDGLTLVSMHGGEARDREPAHQ